MAKKPTLTQNIIIKNLDKDTAKSIQDLQSWLGEKTSSKAVLHAVNNFKRISIELEKERQINRHNQSVMNNVMQAIRSIFKGVSDIKTFASINDEG